MRKYQYLYLLFALFLAGCAAFTPPKVSTPQDAINEANVLLTAIAKQATDNFNSGVMTLEEKDKAVAEVKQYAAKVDSARKLLDAGNPLEAKNQVQLLNTAILALQKRVAEKARKPQ